MATKEDQGSKGVKKKKSLGLSARQSFKRQRQMRGYRNDRETLFTLITAGITIFIVWFVLAGGINQKAFFEECSRIGHNIGSWFSERFGADNIDVTDNGIYLKDQAPDGSTVLDTSKEAEEKNEEAKKQFEN